MRPNPLQQLLAAEEQAQAQKVTKGRSRIEGPTRKELDVARLLCEGMTVREAARSLGKAEATVSAQMYTLYRKLECSSRLELRSRLSELGLLHKPDAVDKAKALMSAAARLESATAEFMRIARELCESAERPLSAAASDN
jgi:DNA-binding CsgD family transcriptional regulator